MTTSSVTGQKMLKFDRSKPVTYNTYYYKKLKPESETVIPGAFIILHRGNEQIISNLIHNGIEFRELNNDTAIEVLAYRINSIKYASQPYEGHFPHQNFTYVLEKTREEFRKGDLLIPVRQKGIRYLMEAFLPEGEGSFFRWNYFDTYLQQKEWFSSYVFDDIAEKFLAENPDVRAVFEDKKKNDAAFAADSFAQLYWIYRQTPYYEKEHMRLPYFFVPLSN
jgi:hypothetical protein